MGLKQDCGIDVIYPVAMDGLRMLFIVVAGEAVER